MEDTPMIKGLRVIDTRDTTEKTLVKTLGNLLYFSDGATCSLEEYNKYFRIKNHEA